jgi:predicted DNA-binding ribbon-helix-helix protein
MAVFPFHTTDETIGLLRAKREARSAGVSYLSGLEKRSLRLNGHSTSLALEPEFWTALESLSARNGVTLAALIGWIDQTRSESMPERALASACRVHALHALSYSGPT